MSLLTRILFSLSRPCFGRVFALPIFATLLLAGCAAPDYSVIELGTPYSVKYAVVISKATHEREDWRTVATELAEKHNATVLIYEGTVGTVREKLAAVMPRYTAFVARPEECGRDYIADVHRLTRQLDDDPWLDTQWGVITGENAAHALSLVTRTKGTLEVKRALATTGLDSTLFDEYFLLSDGQPGGWEWKKPDGAKLAGQGNLEKPDAQAWAEHFSMVPDLLVTSFHGYENGVEMPFSRGILRVADNGEIYPFDNVRQLRPGKDDKPLLASGNAKVYFPVGNCLVGHVNSPRCMVTSMMGRYGVNQLAGYTVDTWFGRGGWGMLALWQTLPGRNSFSESFFFNQQHLLHDIGKIAPDALNYKMRLGTGEVHLPQHIADMQAAGLKFDPRNARGGSAKSPDAQLAGLLWDIDTVAFYGDPAWRAVFCPPKTYAGFLAIGITSKGNEHRLSADVRDPVAAAKNKVPVGLFFTTRLKNIKLLEGAEYEPIIADNFILLLNPKPVKNEKEIVVRFSAEPIGEAEKK